MTELQYIAYFENLAVQSKGLNHNPAEKKNAFFFISDPYTTTEIDNALRNNVSFPAMLLDAAPGMLDSNESTNYTKNINGQFRIIAQAGKDQIREVRETCFILGMEIITRMQQDSRQHKIIPGKIVSFLIEQVHYEPVGPMLLNHYGYVFNFRFICPFGFTVSAASWRDIT